MRLASPFRRTSPAVATLLVVVLLAACGSDEPTADRADPDRPGPRPDVTQTTDTDGNFPQVSEPARDDSLAGVQVQVTEVARLEEPIAVASRPGSDLLYVAERAGRVRSLTLAADGTAVLEPEPVLDMTANTTTESERGLLGLAFAADGSAMFVSYTNPDGNSRVDRYDFDGDALAADSKQELFAVDQPFPNHNGGGIRLGPDGMLWLGLGDGGSADDPDNRAQDPEDRLGKMLRLDPSGAADPDIWALGLRNPWRFSFDAETDDLWIADVGQNAVEEIDFLPSGTPAGTNFGWSGYEGSAQYLPDRVPAESVPPVFEMQHDDGWCSVTGGVAYRGEAIEGLQGAYLFGDYCKPGLHALRLTDGVVSDEVQLGVEVPGLISIDQDADGEVWLSSQEGGLYRLDPVR